ncbi:NAD(P)H-hydrate dehydratase [Candidatus Laterigemmans baculatus]|uniref:NAD(P)H-hydrate dehydratase n=1 Tax=Candidatus Laterigemmans baculatus TaxID=2770505 RepID=UPI0013DD0240|nr:NAD(P)H-hydrate dehydratase [Candidatus Laterigemmans baculatus]
MNDSPSPAPPSQLARRQPESHKGDYGRVLLVGGSRGMAGAISLSAISALKVGSGLVTLAVPDRCLETAAAFNPCLMTHPLSDTPAGTFAEPATEELEALARKFDAFGVGPGMGTGPGAIRLTRWALESGRPMVLDADALNALAEIRAWRSLLRGPAVLTPHPGEWQRICGESPKDRAAQRRAAVEVAAASGAVVLLKGAQTFVTDGSREYTNATGNPGMASGGAGDVLTGVVASLLGQGLSPFEAASLGAWIHGTAGDLAAEELGMAGVTAVDIAAALPAAVELATE